MQAESNMRALLLFSVTFATLSLFLLLIARDISSPPPPKGSGLKKTLEHYAQLIFVILAGFVIATTQAWMIKDWSTMLKKDHGAINGISLISLTWVCLICLFVVLKSVEMISRLRDKVEMMDLRIEALEYRVKNPELPGPHS